MMSVGATLTLNHLLNQQGWARERLARHAGSRIEFRTAPLPALQMAVTETGLVSPAPGQPGDLTVTVSPIALPLLAIRSPRAFDYIGMAGPQALAETVKALMLELEWDFEEDLSRAIGDVAAHSLTQAGRDAYAWQADGLDRLARNFSEYWTEEQPLLARRVDLEKFARQLQDFQAELDRIEGRLRKAGPGQ